MVISISFYVIIYYKLFNGIMRKFETYKGIFDKIFGLNHDKSSL